METVIRLDGLTKYYGKQLGIADLNLEVKSGEIFGFLGPNGAGKTTTPTPTAKPMPTSNINHIGIVGYQEVKLLRYHLFVISIKPC